MLSYKENLWEENLSNVLDFWNKHRSQFGLNSSRIPTNNAYEPSHQIGSSDGQEHQIQATLSQDLLSARDSSQGSQSTLGKRSIRLFGSTLDLDGESKKSIRLFGSTLDPDVGSRKSIRLFGSTLDPDVGSRKSIRLFGSTLDLDGGNLSSGQSEKSKVGLQNLEFSLGNKSWLQLSISPAGHEISSKAESSRFTEVKQIQDVIDDIPQPLGPLCDMGNIGSVGSAKPSSGSSQKTTLSLTETVMKIRTAFSEQQSVHTHMTGKNNDKWSLEQPSHNNRTDSICLNTKTSIPMSEMVNSASKSTKETVHDRVSDQTFHQGGVCNLPENHHHHAYQMIHSASLSLGQPSDTEAVNTALAMTSCDSMRQNFYPEASNKTLETKSSCEVTSKSDKGLSAKRKRGSLVLTEDGIADDYDFLRIHFASLSLSQPSDTEAVNTALAMTSCGSMRQNFYSDASNKTPGTCEVLSKSDERLGTKRKRDCLVLAAGGIADNYDLLKIHSASLSLSQPSVTEAMNTALAMTSSGSMRHNFYSEASNNTPETCEVLSKSDERLGAKRKRDSLVLAEGGIADNHDSLLVNQPSDETLRSRSRIALAKPDADWSNNCDCVENEQIPYFSVNSSFESVIPTFEALGKDRASELQLSNEEAVLAHQSEADVTVGLERSKSPIISSEVLPVSVQPLGQVRCGSNSLGPSLPVNNPEIDTFPKQSLMLSSDPEVAHGVAQSKSPTNSSRELPISAQSLGQDVCDTSPLVPSLPVNNLETDAFPKQSSTLSSEAHGLPKSKSHVNSSGELPVSVLPVSQVICDRNPLAPSIPFSRSETDALPKKSLALSCEAELANELAKSKSLANSSGKLPISVQFISQVVCDSNSLVPSLPVTNPETDAFPKQSSTLSSRTEFTKLAKSKSPASNIGELPTSVPPVSQVICDSNRLAASLPFSHSKTDTLANQSLNLSSKAEVPNGLAKSKSLASNSGELPISVQPVSQVVCDTNPPVPSLPVTNPETGAFPKQSSTLSCKAEVINGLAKSKSKSPVNSSGERPIHVQPVSQAIRQSNPLVPSLPITNSESAVPELVRKMTEPVKFPQDALNLLETGILDGVPAFSYDYKTKVKKWALIKHDCYLCGCQKCRFLKPVTACEFVRHSGHNDKRPNKVIFFKSGFSIDAVVKELQKTDPEKFFDALTTLTDSAINKQNFWSWKNARVKPRRERYNWN